MSHRSIFLILNVVILFGTTAFSQDKVMINSGSWNTPGNWSPFGVPSSTQWVSIGSNYTCTIPAGALAECSNLRLINNADLIIENTATLTITPMVISNPVSGANSGSTILNEGDIYIIGLSTLSGFSLSSGSFFTNGATGRLYVNKLNGSGSTAIATSATFVNFGEINIGNTSDPLGGKGMSIVGDFINQQGASIFIHKSGGFAISTSGSFTNKGICQLGISGTVGGGFYADVAILNDTTGVITIGSASGDGFNQSNLFSSGNVNNKGSISISSCSNGIASRFTNFDIGTININQCDRGISVTLAGTSSSNNGIINIGNTGPISTYGIFQGNNADLTNNGTMHIDSVNFGIGISDSGTQLINEGNIEIGSYSGISQNAIRLVNGAQLLNNPLGVIMINKCSDIGISVQNTGTNLFNYGIISIGAEGTVFNQGMEVYSNSIITNGVNALLEINGSTGYAAFAISNSSVLNNSGTIKMGNLHPINAGLLSWGSAQINNLSDGVIEVNRNTWEAILIQYEGTIVNNSGLIRLGNLATITGGIGLFQGGDMVNLPSGQIEINNGLYSGVKIENAGTEFTNQGNLVIGNLVEIIENGIIVDYSGTMINSSTGTIQIDRIAHNWWSKAVYVKLGNLNNSGAINIGSLTLCSLGIYYEDDFNNLEGGQVTINNITGSALESHSASAHGQNYGDIMIGNSVGIGWDGIGLLDNSTFTNHATGNITINRANVNWWSTGIRAITGTLNNSGNITIGNLANCNRGIYYESAINNLSSGAITIDNITDFALESHFVGGVFTNQGNIFIGSTVACGSYGISILENSFFINQSSGIIELNHLTTNWYSGGIRTKVGQFTNHGLIRLGNVANLHYGLRIGENASEIGTFTNDGMIEFDRMSNTTQAAIYVNIGSTFTNQSAGILKFGFQQPVTIAFRGGGDATNYGQILCKDITFSNVYTDQNLHNKSGSLFHIFAGHTNFIDGILTQATGAILRVEGTLYNFGSVIGSID